MKQDFTALAHMDKIDERTRQRLQPCLTSGFAPSAVRYFRARKATLLSSSSDLLSVRISGFGESFRGSQIVCCNTDNLEDLEISMTDCEQVFQSAADADIFYVKGGTTELSGLKTSSLAKDLDSPASVMKELPRRDPDIVKIDDKAYYQTGTVYVQASLYIVILER
jgi:hypothetical protein